MTMKIYEKDVYCKECVSSITNVIKQENDYLVVLDKTIFFPEGGGQPSDTGKIGNAIVRHVYEKEGVIYHRIDSLPKDNEVRCILDWDKRLDGMQQHCGEHILSGIIKKEYGGNNKGFHMGEEMITIDIDLKEVTNEMITNIENEANKAIYRNVDIETCIVNSKAEANRYPLRKELTIDNDIRIVDIKGFDCVACCGTHPAKSGEVGIIKIYKTEKNKGMTRIYFQCGMRVLKTFQTKHEVLTKINQQYSADDSSVIQKIQKEEKRYMAMKDELIKIKNKQYILEAHRLTKTQNDYIIAHNYEDNTMDDLKEIAKLVIKQTDKVLLLSTASGDVLLTHSGNDGIKCGQIFRKFIVECNGKGGGGNNIAQGRFGNIEDMNCFINKLKLELQKLV